MERIVPSPGIEFNGHFIPHGTVVSVAHYVTHRDPEVYGEDAELFKPERWLESDPQALRKMEHNFMAVSTHPRGLIFADRRSLAREIVRVLAENSAC